MRVWVVDCCAHRVTQRQFEELWAQAGWESRAINDPERARREWDRLNSKPAAS